jgi:hypothetical protein
MRLRPAVFDANIAVFNVTGFVQALAERRQEDRVIVGGLAAEIADYRHRRLLRTRRQRPHDGRTTE